jgi:hypothetical protein
MYFAEEDRSLNLSAHIHSITFSKTLFFLVSHKQTLAATGKIVVK